MAILTKTFKVICANSTVQAVSENIIGIGGAWIASTASLAGVGIMTSLAVVTGTPGTTQVQFAGTVAAPSSAFTLGYSPVAGDLMMVDAVPAAGNLQGY